jgi:hypothetical protein
MSALTGWAYHQARKIPIDVIEREDIEQAAVVGLCRAARNWDASKGAITTYSWAYISNEIAAAKAKALIAYVPEKKQIRMVRDRDPGLVGLRHATSIDTAAERGLHNTLPAPSDHHEEAAPEWMLAGLTAEQRDYIEYVVIGAGQFSNWVILNRTSHRKAKNVERAALAALRSNLIEPLDLTVMRARRAATYTESLRLRAEALADTYESEVA